MAKIHFELVSLVFLLACGEWTRLVYSAKEASKGIQHVSIGS